MRKLAILGLMMFLLVTVGAFAQDTTSTQQTTTTTTRTDVDDDDDSDYNHGSVGVFLDYIRLDNAGTNNFGVGGRVGFNVHPNVQLEGELGYDFRESRTATIGTGLTTQTYDANFRILHGLFGPKFQSTGPVRIFVTTKLGFINFGVETTNAPAGFVNRINDVVDGDTHFAFYPGGGIELGAGWFAIRGEVGDEMYFRDGANHNFKMTIGPTFRF